MTDEIGHDHYSLKNKVTFHAKRVWFEVFSLFSIFCLIYTIPTSYLTSNNPKLGIISLFISKFLFVSAGGLHAHIMRKLFFPYIKFDQVSQNGFSMKGLLIVVLYAVVIIGWTRGG